MDNKGKAAWIELPDLRVIFKAIGFKINICQIWRKIDLATPNPRASPIDYTPCVITHGQAADGEGLTVQNTIKVCVSVTPNCHELVFGDRNCETGDPEPWVIIRQWRTILVVTVNGVVHLDVNLTFHGNAFNVDVPNHWLRLAVQVASTIDKIIFRF